MIKHYHSSSNHIYLYLSVNVFFVYSIISILETLFEYISYILLKYIICVFSNIIKHILLFYLSYIFKQIFIPHSLQHHSSHQYHQTLYIVQTSLFYSCFIDLHTVACWTCWTASSEMNHVPPVCPSVCPFICPSVRHEMFSRFDH